jgi:hypothetical protein
MRFSLGCKSAFCVAAALLLVMCVPVCLANASSKADKHAQKIEKKLAKFKAGALVHLAFNNNTECTGTVNVLSDKSFTFNNSETNAKETHLYSDVSDVEKGKEYIGQGSGSQRHIHIF